MTLRYDAYIGTLLQNVTLIYLAVSDKTGSMAGRTDDRTTISQRSMTVALLCSSTNQS